MPLDNRRSILVPVPVVHLFILATVMILNIPYICMQASYLFLPNWLRCGRILEKIKLTIKYGVEARHKCKHDFPMKKVISESKVICRGSARRFGLRVSGRRNALGSILTKRVCKWASGCSPAMALVFRCNTHTLPNFRVPITKETHDKDCKADCLAKEIPFCIYLRRRGHLGVIASISAVPLH